MGDKYRIAVASNDGINVNEHYGRARYFFIYDVIEDEYYKKKKKKELIPACNGGVHDNEHLKRSADYFSDCRYVIASRIGPGATTALGDIGVEGYEFTGDIDEAIDRLVRYKQVQALFN